MRGQHDRPPEILGADQTAPGGAFTSTEFDVALSKFRNYLANSKTVPSDSLRNAALINVKKFMVAYRDIALAAGKPYAKGDVAEWRIKLTRYGISSGLALVFLSNFRLAQEAGIIPESVWNPKKYLEEHPEQKKDTRAWYEILFDKAGKTLGKVAMWGGIGLAAYFILPKLLLTGVKAYSERKKVTA
jgi:hypothetical protein